MLRATLIAFCFIAIAGNAGAQQAEYPGMGADIFDAKASAETLIASAVDQAKREEKRVLLLFGANWCPWCRRLHAALTKHKTIREKLRRDFVLVFIDANTRHDRRRNAHILERYGNPTLRFGLPVFVVLDQEGYQLTTRETASLAADSDAKESELLLEFLREWTK